MFVEADRTEVAAPGAPGPGGAEADGPAEAGWAAAGAPVPGERAVAGDDRPLASLSTEALDREISTLSAHLNAATCRWLVLVGELDHREGHGEWGFALCSQWLAWRCGISARAAREHVRVARRLRELPMVRARFAEGRLSYSKVRILTRMERIASESELVELARHATAAQLERMARAHASAVSVARGEEAHARRELAWHWDDDGSLCVKARLPAEEGATFLLALDAARDQLRERAREGALDGGLDDGGAEPADRDRSRRPERGPAGPRPEPSEASRILLGSPPSNADALGVISESMLAHGAAERPAPERFQLTVHVEAESLLPGDRSAGDDPARDQAASDDAACELERGPAIPAETARRLGCDASLVAIVERDGAALDVGRRSRAVPVGMRRALRARDRGCRFPGCANHRFVDAHHIVHWAHGGETGLDNLVLLCRAHHRAVHEGGFALERLPDGSLLFRRPDGRPIPHVPEPVGGDGAYLEIANRGLGLEIDSETGMSLSAGQPMDLSLAVDALMDYAPP